MENDNLPAQVRLEDLPSEITKTFNGIADIEKKVKETEAKAKNAQESANKAKNKNAGWSFGGRDKKEAIEALQTAAVDQADALSSSMDATKELFEYQEKMTRAIKYLFCLGVTNMAANRTVVQQLEMKLRNASRSELSELARKEIKNVILQLKAQEDIQNRISGHEELLRKHKNCFEEHVKKVNADFEALKKQHSALSEELKSGIEERLTEIDTILKQQISAEMDSSFSAIKLQMESIENRISDIQERLDNKSLFDSAFFKISIAVLAVLAFAIHFIPLI